MADKLNIFKKRELRRSLRQSQTKAERFLWFALRNKRTGYKFYRQFSILNFIVDFCCPMLKIIVELDGGYHEFDDVYTDDLSRQRKLESLGYKVIRYTNIQVYKHLESVWQDIVNHCKEREKTKPQS